MSGPTQLRTFDGAVALVTGGASGIGRALSKELARRGAHTVLADRQVELAEETATAIRDAGGAATVAELDVRDFAAFEKLVREIVQEHGRLDYLFNNAGIVVIGEVRVNRIEDWNQVLDVNIRGVVHGVQAAYSVMLEQGFGHIVNTASVAGLVPMPGCVSYAASKHAVVGLSKSLRIEAAQHGVRISALCPGFIRTAIIDGGRYGSMLQPLPGGDERDKLLQRIGAMDPDVFAPRVLRAVSRNQATIIVPGWWRIFWWIERLSPSLSLYLGKRALKMTQRIVDEAEAKS